MSSTCVSGPRVVVTKRRFVMFQYHFVPSLLSHSGCSSLSREVFYHMMTTSENIFAEQHF